MKPKLICLLLLAVTVLTACNDSAITDEETIYELPVVEHTVSEHITHTIDNDGMYRSVQYAVGSILVIDPNYFSTHPITRGDVVLYRRSDNGLQLEHNIARIVGLPGETVTVKKGQIYINNKKLDTFYGKEFYMRTEENPSGFVDGRKGALTLEKEIQVPEGHSIIASDVWWRNGFYHEPFSQDNIIGKVVGRVKPTK